MEAGSPQELEGLVDSRELVLGWLGEAQQVDDECPEHRIQREMADIRHMMAGGHKRHQMAAIENWRAEYASGNTNLALAVFSCLWESLIVFAKDWLHVWA